MNTISKITREQILDGHEEYHAPVERKKDYANYCCQQSTLGANATIEDLQAQANGYGVLQHPELLEKGGLPSPFNPEENINYDSTGDPILIAKAEKEKLANKLGLSCALSMSKDALENEYKNKLQQRQRLESTPGMTPARPRPM